MYKRKAIEYMKNGIKNRFEYWMEYFKNRERHLYQITLQDYKLNNFDLEFSLYSIYVNMSKKYYSLWTDIDKKLFIQLTKDIAYSNNWTSATFDIIDKTIQRCIDKDEIFDLISWAYYINSGDYIPADYVDIPEGIDREKLDFEFEE